MAEYTILGLDPGSANFGYAVIQVSVGRTFRYKVLEDGKLSCMLRSLKGDVTTDINLFKAEVRRILRKHKPTHLIAERFMTRGIKGATIEYISVMLGVLTQMGIKNVKFITAAQWKNRWNRYYCLDDFYPQVCIEDHQVDAANIALYGSALWFDTPYFDFFASDLERKQFIRKLEYANTGKVIQRKGRTVGKADLKEAEGGKTTRSRRSRASAAPTVKAERDTPKRRRRSK